MPPLPPNITKAGLIRGYGGWNNSSLSRRSNTTRGLLSTRVPQSLGTTGGGIPNPSIGIGVTRLAMPRGATGTWKPVSLSTALSWHQLGARLDPLTISAEFWSSAFANNGNTLAVGDEAYSGTGIVRTYDWNGTAWIERPTLAGASIGDKAGHAVALSSNGAVLAIGEPGYNNNADTGRVRVFDWNGSTWTERDDAAKLVGASEDDETGFSVALTSNGAVAAIGEYRYDNGTYIGRVRVFDWNGSTTWTERDDAAKLVGASGFDEAGHSVALSSNGAVLAIGEYGYTGGNYIGRVRVFDWNGSTWTERNDAAKLVGASEDDGAGFDVALSSNGAVLAIGEPGYDNGGKAGRVRVFDWNGSTTWTERADAAKLVGASANDEAGGSLALSSNGAVLAIGEYGYTGGDFTGRVRVFDWNGSAWNARTDLVGTGPTQFFGFGLSLSNDGTRIAAPATDGTIVFMYS